MCFKIWLSFFEKSFLRCANDSAEKKLFDSYYYVLQIILWWKTDNSLCYIVHWFSYHNSSWVMKKYVCIPGSLNLLCTMNINNTSVKNHGLETYISIYARNKLYSVAFSSARRCEAYRDRRASSPLLPVSSQVRIVKYISLLYILTQVVGEILICSNISYTYRVVRPLHFVDFEANISKTILWLGCPSVSGRLI